MNISLQDKGYSNAILSDAERKKVLHILYKKMRVILKKYFAVNAEKRVYTCKNCGNWKTDYILDLYAPKKPEEIPNKQYGIKTVAEWGYIPYVMEFDLEEDYKILKRFIHKCTNCGKRMHKASNSELKTLSCPKCGKSNQSGGIIFLD